VPSGARAYLELVRVFLTPSAAADSYAGFVAAAALERIRPDYTLLIYAAAGSISSYWLGMALNDLCDARRDAAHQPGRPIPSGRVSRRGAVILCVILGAAAIAFGAAAGTLSVSAALLATVVLYDAGAKHVPYFGNLVMGACRSWNFLLGAAAAVGGSVALSRPEVLAAAGLIGLFITGVTAASRLEELPPDPGKLRAVGAALLLIPAALFAYRPGFGLAAFNAGALAALIVAAVGSACAAAREQQAILASGRGFQGLPAAAILVRKALGGVFLVDAGAAICLVEDRVQAFEILCVLWGLFAVALLWKRSWMRAGSTGS
jgi:hypothetical protein